MATVLLIEDSADNRNVTELILADAGHTVISAGDGRQSESGLHQTTFVYF
jgi:CheY-like chemotaxis protein